MSDDLPMRAYIDTAVLVAASVAGHPHHIPARATLQMVRKKTVIGHISGHGLSEIYAVLTSAPFAPPIYPSEAWKLLSTNVLPYFEIVTLTHQMYRDTIEQCADKGWIGGRIYDALHLCCARKAACDRIYTFNVRHFQQLAPELADRIGAPRGFQ
jgi:predicted nucleic acid-binding protein